MTLIKDQVRDNASASEMPAITCNVMAAGCPSRQVLQHLSSRWGVLIMVALLSETHRFSSLRRRIEGVSERMLAQTLQSLESDGMIKRYSYDTIPPHVEYSLTPLGRVVAVKLQELVPIIEASQAEILNNSR